MVAPESVSVAQTIPIRMIMVDIVPGLLQSVIAKLNHSLNLQHVEAVTGYPVTMPIEISHHLHRLEDLHFGEYPKSTERETPFDFELLTRLSQFESMALQCLDKLEKVSVVHQYINWRDEQGLAKKIYDGNELSFMRRKQIYLKHLRYWNDVITKREINLYVCTNIPHFGADLIIYLLCKVKGIRILTFEDVTYVGRLVSKNDIWSEPTTILEHYNRLRQTHNGEVSLAPGIEKFYRFQTDKTLDPNPPHMNRADFGGFAFHTYGSWQAIRRLIPHTTAVLRGKSSIKNVISKFLTERSYGRKDRDVRRSYDKLARVPDKSLNEQFVYLALHVQPEMSTAPLAGVFVDQVNILNLLLDVLPNNVRIYVKEHPAQPCIARTVEFYEELAQHPRVTIVERRTSTFWLIRNCVAVATCTGTVGLEALFKQKPVLVFGSVFYECAPGAFRIRTAADLENAFQLIQNGTRPSLADLRYFLKALELGSLPGHLGVLNSEKRGRFEIDEEDTATSVAHAISTACSFLSQLPKPVNP